MADQRRSRRDLTPRVRRNLVFGSRTPILVAEGPRLRAARGAWVKLRTYTSRNAAYMGMKRASGQRRRFKVAAELQVRGTALWGRSR